MRIRKKPDNDWGNGDHCSWPNLRNTVDKLWELSILMRKARQWLRPNLGNTVDQILMRKAWQWVRPHLWNTNLDELGSDLDEEKAWQWLLQRRQREQESAEEVGAGAAKRAPDHRGMTRIYNVYFHVYHHVHHHVHHHVYQHVYHHVCQHVY